MTTDTEKASLGIDMLYVLFAGTPYINRANWTTHRRFTLDPELNQAGPKFTLDPLYNGQVGYAFVVDPLYREPEE